jgi:methionyl aminopeptidase
MTPGINPSYNRAGQISREIKKGVESRDWRGKSYSELCEFVESSARNLGGGPAFPCNVCVNESAAHYTAEIEDSKVVPQDALLKVDIGVQVDGYIADTAVTLCYNNDLFDMAEATKSALAEALKGIKVGARTSDVGRIVESYAARRGYRPISNLSGHSLEQYVVHAGTSVPNVWSPSPSSFKQDKVYAVEPFLTTSAGSGIVVEGTNENIFGLVARKKTKDAKLNSFLDTIWAKCNSLPFAARWFTKEYPKSQIGEMIKSLTKLRLVHPYPELLEAKGEPVAQAEHTVTPTVTGMQILT